MRWAFRTELLGDDTLRSLELVGNPERDRRRIRRALTVDELRALIESTRRGPVRVGVTGPVRALVYIVAVETGLRRNEIRTLRVGDLIRA